MAVDYATLKKGGFMRQKQKNHFSLRLRVVGGNLTATQLAKIAEVAEKFGDGHVHLTSRQSVEIPFVKLEQIEEVKKALSEGGVERAFVAREFEPLPLVRAKPFARVAVLIRMHWQRNWMTGILQENYRISSSLALLAARTTA